MPLQKNQSSSSTNDQQKKSVKTNDPEVPRYEYEVESQDVTKVKTVTPDKDRKNAKEIAVVYKLSIGMNFNKEKIR